MKRTGPLIMIVFSLSSFCFGQGEPTLQTWAQVAGTLNGQRLGDYVLGMKPSANLPYRAAVSTHPNPPPGVTMFFRLQDSTDTTPQLTLPGEHPLVGDLNNDGWQDIVLVRSVNLYDTVYIYWGTATGIDTVNPLLIPSENQGDDLLPSCIGDLNNDGKADLILAAIGWGPGSTGKVYLYLNPIDTALADGYMIGDSTDHFLGASCSVGDLNSDGFSDLIVKGIKQSGTTEQRYDYVDIYWGGIGDTLNLVFGMRIKTANINNFYGVACFDVNGDGIPDLLWSARDSANYVYIHFGGSSFSSSPSLRLANTLGLADFGFTVANAGDMNGDGYSDVAVGCPGATITTGYVLVYSGGPKIDEKFDAAVGQSTDGYFGYSVSSVADVTSDGLADLIVGAPDYQFHDDKGYCEVFKGDPRILVTGIEHTITNPEDLELLQNYPNPFNPETTIEYTLKMTGTVRIRIYDTLGRLVRILLDDREGPGPHAVRWDGRDQNNRPVPSGVYYYQLSAGNQTTVKKAIHLK